MIKRSIHKSAVIMMLVLGLLLTSAAPSALAQGRRGRNRNYDRVYYDRNYNQNYDNYYDSENTTGKTVKRVGIGALGGALLGGKKGLIIGAGVGAAGGYLYHRHKVNKERDRYYGGW